MDSQLTEKQFELIKELVSNGGVLMLCPEISEDDDEDTKIELAENRINVEALASAEFLKDVSDKCQKAIDVSIEITGRSFKAYMLTETAYHLFNPQEGVVN